MSLQSYEAIYDHGHQFGKNIMGGSTDTKEKNNAYIKH